MAKRRRNRSRVCYDHLGNLLNPEECDPILEDIANEGRHFTPTGHLRVDQVPGATIIINLESDDPALKSAKYRRS